jgi:hypothetical protein
MAGIYFPLQNVQKTLCLTSLNSCHPSIEGHQAFKGWERQKYSTDSSSRTASSPLVQILPPTVDAAIIALCEEALDATHMDAYVAHIDDSRLCSSR